jgi:hypothetical protein
LIKEAEINKGTEELAKEAEELIKILATIIKTTKNRSS